MEEKENSGTFMEIANLVTSEAFSKRTRKYSRKSFKFHPNQK